MNKAPFSPDEIKIAVIGGGTGSFTLLSALKRHTSRIAALVNMADDGGSTGQLRDELGVLPPGDVRQCLVALSDSEKLRDLFNYRFEDGSMKGHAFGNLFLTAVEKMTGNFSEGVEVAGEVLGITGTVEPMTLSDVTLVLNRGAGQVRGEFAISELDFNGQQPDLSLEPIATPSPRALEAIKRADMIVIAPGNLYGSLAPALIIPDVGDVLKNATGLKVYVSNLVTKPGQTDGFTVHDYADEIHRLAGAEFLDAVLYNNSLPDDLLMKRYAKEGELPVRFDNSRTATYNCYGSAMLAGAIWQGNSGDPIAGSRTLIRHDSELVARALMELYDKLRT